MNRQELPTVEDLKDPRIRRLVALVCAIECSSTHTPAEDIVAMAKLFDAYIFGQPGAKSAAVRTEE